MDKCSERTKRHQVLQYYFCINDTNEKSNEEKNHHHHQSFIHLFISYILWGLNDTECHELLKCVKFPFLSVSITSAITQQKVVTL